MSYLDGCLIPVPADRHDAYLEHARAASAIFRDYGAQRIFEGWGDDVPDGKMTDMRRAVAAQPGETIVFTFIEWPSRAVRDAAWEKLHNDPRMRALSPPFDGARMIFGGFQPMAVD